jgi:uncharacterized membrane protein YfhO
VVQDGANRVELEVVADGDGWLVLLDAYAPGWRASVDGEAVAIARADVCFRAVPVAAGTCRVVLRYLPWSVVVGSVVTTITALVALWVVIGAVRSRRGRACR